MSQVALTSCNPNHMPSTKVSLLVVQHGGRPRHLDLLSLEALALRLIQGLGIEKYNDNLVQVELCRGLQESQA